MVDLKPFEDAEEKRVRDARLQQEKRVREAKFQEDLRQMELQGEERIQKEMSDSLMRQYGGQDKLIEWGGLLILLGIISWIAVPDDSPWASLLFVLAIVLWIFGGLIVLLALIDP